MRSTIIFAGLSLCLSTAAANAGDASHFEALGFSNDGKYYAFAQRGTGDGSGFPYAGVAVLDVAKNAFVASQTVVLENYKAPRGTPLEDAERAGEEKAVVTALKKIGLYRFGIQRGVNLGRDLLVRLPTDHGDPARNLFSFEHRAEGGAIPMSPRFEVLVETKDWQGANEQDGCSAYDDTATKLLKLSIAGRDGTDGSVALLQEDKEPARSRSCVFGYLLRRVTAFRGGLVVVLSYSGPGFEGPDVRHMVVTGLFSP
jgi:predicted secreted protein